MTNQSPNSSALKCNNVFVLFTCLPEQEKGYYDYDPCRRHVIVLNQNLLGKDEQINASINTLKERLHAVLNSTPFQDLMKFKVFLYYDEDYAGGNLNRFRSDCVVVARAAGIKVRAKEKQDGTQQQQQPRSGTNPQSWSFN